MSSGDDYTTIWIPNQQVRARAEVPSTTVEALEAVRGFLVPRYVEYMEDGRRVAELHQVDLNRVIEGYACGECLAYFDRQFAECPCCSHPLDPGKDVVDYHPDHWDSYEGRTSQEILSDRF